MYEHKIYAIFDQAVDAFNTPQFMVNDAVAIRAFASVLREPGSLFSQSPTDFTLFCLGTVSLADGSVVVEDIPRKVANATSLLAELSETPIEETENA